MVTFTPALNKAPTRQTSPLTTSASSSLSVSMPASTGVCTVCRMHMLYIMICISVFFSTALTPFTFIPAVTTVGEITDDSHLFSSTSTGMYD